MTLSFLILTACQPAGDTGAPEARLRVPHIEAPAVPARTVVWFTIDTLNQDHLGPSSIHDSSPHHDAFFETAVVLPNTVVTRGVTVISLPSIATGTYPRTHRVDDKDIPAPEDMPPMVQELLQEQGFETYGYSSNICVMHNRGWTETLCVDGTEIAEGLGDQQRDQVVIDAFLEDLAELPVDQDAFFWLHLRDPHSDHTARKPWVDRFYTAERDDRSPITNEELNAITTGEVERDEDFDAWLQAVYASQVASNDGMFAEVLEALDAHAGHDIVFTGTDHGEELGEHHDYFHHGCSTYDGVLNTTWSFRAPGIEPTSIDQRVSTTDMLPTLLDLLELEIGEEIEGRSLVPVAAGEDTEPQPVFFQRGSTTAGVVLDDRKYFLYSGEDMPRCSPYDAQFPWPGPAEALFDLGEDPGELDNRIEAEPEPEEMTVLCEWVTDFTWGDGYSKAKSLIVECEDRLP